MKSALVKFFGYCLIATVFACDDQDNPIVEDPTSYTWNVSAISPDNDLTVFKFKKGEDGALYMLGWLSGNKSIFAKLNGSEWDILAEVNETVYGDFAVFRDTVYFGTSQAVKKARNGFVDTFMTTNVHGGVEVFQNKLFITGSYLPYNGEDYSVLSYDESRKIAPVFKEWNASGMRIANEQLIIIGPEGAPLIFYDRGYMEESTYSTYKKDFLNIDVKGAIYSKESGDVNDVVITKFQQKKSEPIGNTIPANSVLNMKLQFYENAVVISGQNLSGSTSNAFFLTSNNTWKAIDTGFVIYDLINYDNKIFAASDGRIMELTVQ